MKKGFTLIELIIVIAIVGVLAAVILAVINPIEQLAKSRDAGRRSSVSQLGKAMEAYFANSPTGLYPATSATWQTSLIGPNGTKDIKGALTAPSGASWSCPAANAETGYCYATLASSTDAVIWTPAESASEKAKASCGTSLTIIVWVASRGKTGAACIATAATIPGSTIAIY